MTQLFKKVVVKCEDTPADVFTLEVDCMEPDKFVWLSTEAASTAAGCDVKVTPARLRKLGQEMVRIANLLDGKGDAEEPDEYVI